MVPPRGRPRSGAGAARRGVGRAARRRPDEHELQGRLARTARTSSASRARTRACSRSTGRTRSHNTIAAPPTPASARRSSRALPEHDALVLEFLDGEVMSRRDAPPRRPAARRRASLPPAARGRAGSSATSTCSRSSAAIVDVVQERGFRLPDRYLEFEPQVRALEEAMRVRREPTVPCNNDLLAENFIDVRRRAAG